MTEFYRLPPARRLTIPSESDRSTATGGRALRWNTAVLATGFLVLTASTLGPNRNLGLLLASGLVASWLAAVLLLPALLAGDGRGKGRREGRREGPGSGPP